MTWRDWLPPILTKAFTWSRTSGIFSLRGPVWSNIDYGTLVTEGFANAVVFACISEIMRAAGGVPWQLKQRASSRGGKPQEVSDDHDAWKILRRPNPLQAGSTFREGMVGFYYLSGNDFLLRVSTTSRQRERPQELYLLLPDKTRFTPVYDAQHQLIAYQYTEHTPTGQPLAKRLYALRTFPSKGGVVIDNTTREPDGHLLHVKHFTPTDDWYAFSPVLAAAHSIDNLNAALAWNTALLQQYCRPPVVLTSEHTIGDKQALREQINEIYGGPAGSGRPLLLDGGLKAEKLGLSPAEMDWLKGKEDAGLDICRALNVAPELVGYAGSKTFSNYETARKALYTEVVFPVLGLLASELTEWLLPLYDERLYLDIDRDAVDAIRQERMALFAELSKPGAWWIPVNRKLAMVGLPTGGPEWDQLWVPNNLVPMALAGEESKNLGVGTAELPPLPVIAGRNGHAEAGI